MNIENSYKMSKGEYWKRVKNNYGFKNRNNNNDNIYPKNESTKEDWSASNKHIYFDNQRLPIKIWENIIT